MRVRKRFLRHLSEDEFQRQIHGSRSVGRIFHHNSSIAGDEAEDANGTVLAVGDFLEDGFVGGTDEESIVLLIFGSPNFED